jgi:hypothetical protein
MIIFPNAQRADIRMATLMLHHMKQLPFVGNGRAVNLDDLPLLVSFGLAIAPRQRIPMHIGSR